MYSINTFWIHSEDCRIWWFFLLCCFKMIITKKQHKALHLSFLHLPPFQQMFWHGMKKIFLVLLTLIFFKDCSFCFLMWYHFKEIWQFDKTKIKRKCFILIMWTMILKNWPKKIQKDTFLFYINSLLWIDGYNRGLSNYPLESPSYNLSGNFELESVFFFFVWSVF